LHSFGRILHADFAVPASAAGVSDVGGRAGSKDSGAAGLMVGNVEGIEGEPAPHRSPGSTRVGCGGWPRAYADKRVAE
jgi:hypothetical protein